MRRTVMAAAVVLLSAGVSDAQVLLGIDGPTGDVRNPVAVCGFAVDLAAMPRAGIASVVGTFYSAATLDVPTGTRVVPAVQGYSRPDIAATYHAVQDANLGWCLPPTVLPDGVTVLTVRAEPRPGMPYGAGMRDWTFCVNCAVFSWTNYPKQGATVPQTFTALGVAKDMDTGALPRWVRLFTVDRAHPDYIPRVLGYATLGEARPGSVWDGYGWSFTASLSAGTYDLMAETTMWSGEIEQRVVRVTVQ